MIIINIIIAFLFLIGCGFILKNLNNGEAGYQQCVKAIKFVGWLILIGNGLTLLLPFMNIGHFLEVMRAYPLTLKILTFVTLVIYLGRVIAGFNIINLKEFGRQLGVIMAVVDIPHLFIGYLVYLQHMPMIKSEALSLAFTISMDALFIFIFCHKRIKDIFLNS